MVGWQPEALQNRAGTGLRGVPIAVEKSLFELGELVGVEFLSGRGEEPLLGDRHLP